MSMQEHKSDMYYLLSLRVNDTDIMLDTNKQHIKHQHSLSLSNSSLSSSEEYKLYDTYNITHKTC